ncbi:hypothetical protein IFR05_006021 [Cadophora sp. M221]|nr:hypothetical protein IFR05_006021 [Cadophora sp. M221]
MADHGTSDNPTGVYSSVPDMSAPAQPYPLFPGQHSQAPGALLVRQPRAEIPGVPISPPALINGAPLLAAPGHVVVPGHVAGNDGNLPGSPSENGYLILVSGKTNPRFVTVPAPPGYLPLRTGQGLAAPDSKPIYGLVLFLPNGRRASADTHRVMAFHNELYTKAQVRQSYLEGNMAYCVGREISGEARCKKRGVDQKGAFPLSVNTPDGVGCAACHWDSQGRQCALYLDLCD